MDEQYEHKVKTDIDMEHQTVRVVIEDENDPVDITIPGVWLGAVAQALTEALHYVMYGPPENREN